MLNVRRVFYKLLLKPHKMEYSMYSYDMKTSLLMIFCMFCLMFANTAEVVAVAVGSQQSSLNYKQQLQYQMQQHDKYEYQQHIKQQQQYYQQQYQQQPTPTALALLQQEQVQQQPQPQPQPQRHHQLPSAPYLSAKPTQILQTAASLLVDDGNHPHSETLALGQPEFTSANGQRRRPGNRKRKRRPQPLNHEDDIVERPTALNSSPPYWRGQVEDDKKIPETEGVAIRPSLQASFKRRKQPAIREPLAALEKEQKLYEMRNKPENFNGNNPGNSRTSADLKNILKNSGGLSLSEILQQKNLSLDDLLKGKQNALQALQTTAVAPVEKTKHPASKPSFKLSVPSVKLPESSGSEERSKLNALHRLKLFGSSSRPSGLQVGLADHLTTRRKEGNLYSSTTASPTTTTTVRPSTTKIPIYKKILHQRPTLKPTLVLKNMAVMATAEPEKFNNSWESKEEEQHMENENNKSSEKEEKVEEEDAEEELEELESEDYIIPETTTSKGETTMTPTTATTSSTTTTTTTTSTLRPITEKTTNRDIHATTRRMFTSTRGHHGRTTYRYTTSTTTTPAPPPPPTTASSSSTTSSTTTATPLPMTTTTTTSTTTASSSTMNLTPKANLNLNTEDIRERIQETLLKNLIEKEDSFKKSSMESGDNEDDLENFFEETVKPKTTKAYETSTITTRMKQFSPLYSTSTSTTTISSTTSTSSTTLRPSLDSITTSRENVIPDFDNVDDRTDLLELIEDRRSGNRLFKVLEQRNMTLEELIEHRKRGSSQLHLATIVESPSSRFYPDKKVVLQDNMDIVTAFENFPHFNLLNLKSVKPDDIKTDSQGSSYFTSIIDIEPTDEVYKNRKRPSALLAADLDKASLMPDRSEKSLGFFPSWKTLALASLATTTTTNNNNINKNSNNNNKDVYTTRQNNRNNNIPFYLQQPKMLLENNNNDNNNNNNDEDIYDIKDNELVLITRDDDDNNEDEEEAEGDDEHNEDYQNENPIQAAVRLPEQTAEAIENEVARAHDLVDLELSGHGFKRSPQAAGALLHSQRHGTFYTNMPAGIKSAIVASATIVLTALITFMVIFAVCRWKQRRQRMTNVMKSYNAMKSKMPTIATTTATAAMGAGMGGGCGMTAALVTNPNSRRSSFRDMHDLLGGSGLSVAATITTTSSGLSNTPTLATKTLTNASSPCLTPILNRTSHKLATATATATTTKTNVMTGNNCNKNMLQHHSNYKQNPINNSSSCSSNSNSNSNISCMGRPLQRQSSLLFQRNANNAGNSNNNNNNNSCLGSHINSKNVKQSSATTSSSSSSSPATNLAILSGCNLLDIKRNNKMNGSTTSLSFSLTNGHNVANAHINTMDANSPEVQEYLFDTLRNSF